MKARFKYKKLFGNLKKILASFSENSRYSKNAYIDGGFQELEFYVRENLRSKNFKQVKRILTQLEKIEDKFKTDFYSLLVECLIFEWYFGYTRDQVIEKVFTYKSNFFEHCHWAFNRACCEYKGDAKKFREDVYMLAYNQIKSEEEEELKILFNEE